ncbi:antiviral innate immune response receptor RIG-I-like [Glandiceps talaboti]
MLKRITFLRNRNIFAKKRKTMDFHTCEVCDVEVSGYSNYQQHLRGKAHAKKERQQMLYGPRTTPPAREQQQEDVQLLMASSSGIIPQTFHCDVCGVDVSGSANYRQHLQGRPHAKRREHARLFGPRTSQVNTITTDEDAMSEMTTDSESPSNYDTSGSSIQLQIHKQSPSHLAKAEIDGDSTGSSSDYYSTGGIDGGEMGDSCEVCKIDSFTSFSHKHDHFSGKKHKQNMAKQSSASCADPGRFCNACNVVLSTPAQAFDHLNSPNHKSNIAKTMKAPERVLPSIKTEMMTRTPPHELTQKDPRSYQVELYEKAIQEDSIVFLPTGTGKTLIAAMVVSHMLQQNPKRQIVFLVDRVLLVIQQSKVLKTELSHLKIDGKKVEIAELCGEKQDVSGQPLHEHHILVTTAAYYLNLLENGTVRWQDLSLVVFDEAHHCTKSHPFNVILEDHYVKYAETPKLLGLTASPAGQLTVKQTYLMLQKLLLNFGSAKLAFVEENKDDLLKFKTEAEPIITSVNLNMKETELSEQLQMYLFTCYYKLDKLISHLSDYIDLNNVSVITSSLLQDLQRNISDILLPMYQRQPPIHQFLSHVLDMADVLGVLWECGLEIAIEKLKSVMDGSNIRVAKEMKIQLSGKIHKIVKEYKVGSNEMTAVTQLLRELEEHMDWKNGIALVLVKMRRSAKSICKYLNESSLLRQKSTQAIRMVGHGGGSQDGGMSVNKQKSTIQQIWKDNNNRVIVATSVAEEGLDLPTCDLVLVMDPPNNVTALVQIRGRARKRGAKFIILCRNHEQRQKIQDLLRKEKNMEEAAEMIKSASTVDIY